MLSFQHAPSNVCTYINSISSRAGVPALSRLDDVPLDVLWLLSRVPKDRSNILTDVLTGIEKLSWDIHEQLLVNKLPLVGPSVISAWVND